MSALTAVTSELRFLRKTSLDRNEANTNFKMLDNDIGEAVTSEETDCVTPLMSKIYTRLLLTPSKYKESDRILRFTGEESEDGSWTTAWVQLCRHLRVSSETARKALKWLHEKGIIGYSAFKNGVGIRIFLNRAVRSIAERKEGNELKIFPSFHTSPEKLRTSPAETPFKGSYAEKEDLEKDLNPHAPKNGAAKAPQVINASYPSSLHAEQRGRENPSEGELRGNAPPRANNTSGPSFDQTFGQLRVELLSEMRHVTAEAVNREVTRTREWFEERALPKAIRIAQKESYNVLRQYGFVGRRTVAHSEVGRNTSSRLASHSSPSSPKPKNNEEIRELAESCVALFELQGKPLETTLNELTASAGSWLGVEDLERIGEAARQLLRDEEERQG